MFDEAVQIAMSILVLMIPAMIVLVPAGIYLAERKPTMRYVMHTNTDRGAVLVHVKRRALLGWRDEQYLVTKTGVQRNDGATFDKDDEMTEAVKAVLSIGIAADSETERLLKS